MEFHTEKHIAGSLKLNWHFLMKLLISGFFTAFGIYEVAPDKLELSLVALIIIPVSGLFFTWLKLEADANIVRLIAIAIVATAIAVVSGSIFLSLATFMLLEGSTHKNSFEKENGFLWLKGAIAETSEKELNQLAKGHLLFKMLSDDEWGSLVEYCEVMKLKAGDTLIRQGEFNHHLFLIGKGTVNVIMDGRKIASISQGDIVGEISASGLSMPTADVVSEDGVIAFAFPIERINACALTCPAFSDKMREIGMGRESYRARQAANEP
ncbi:MAG: cyclic nucleotide-binding domain-containing protein [Mariprofundaceae bacterium]